MEHNNSNNHDTTRAELRNRLTSERGSVITYILITIFLIGILTMALTDGPKKNIATQQLDKLVVDLQTDFNTIESAVINCILVYPTDPNANPNKPFPLVGDALATTGALADAQCPGAPAGSRGIFSGKSITKLSLLDDTATYTTTYTSDTTEGVFVTITRTASSPLWTEALARINAKYSQCRVEPSGNTLYFWLKRLPTSVIANEGGACGGAAAACPSGGVEVGGYCWHYAGDGESCDDACSGKGLSYDGGTASYAASSDENCEEVLDALGAPYPGTVFFGVCPLPAGCFVELDEDRGRCNSTNSSAAAPGHRRPCACQ